jgi:carbon storage regulator CsrA
MLVLTRREKERIVFPEVDITIELISLSGNRAKVGIAAPDGIRVLREEVAKRAAEFQPVAKPAVPEQKLSHAIRNKLHGITIAAGLLRKQLNRGMVQAAEVTAESLQKQLSDLSQASHEKHLAQGPVREKSKRLALVVDDDDNERHLLAGFLRMTGFDVATAGDGADALNYLASHSKPDVVLLDMLMPRCDGASTVRAIRNSEHYQGLKVFAISGTSPGHLGIETGPQGIDRWFQKPCDPEQLVQEIQRDLLPAM